MTFLKRRNGGLLPALRSDFSDLFEMDHVFNEPFFESPVWIPGKFSRVPATNIRETNDEFVVELAVPGLKKKDFHVDVNNNTLEIKVEKEEESKEKKEQYTRREYNYEAFFRSFNLPETVQEDKIKAEYEDGILKVHLPKVPEAKKKPVKEIAVV